MSDSNLILCGGNDRRWRGKDMEEQDSSYAFVGKKVVGGISYD